jgi:hypothetical protein
MNWRQILKIDERKGAGARRYKTEENEDEFNQTTKTSGRFPRAVVSFRNNSKEKHFFRQ